MKKFFMMAAIVSALCLAGCSNGVDYKAQGAELAKELDLQVENQDTAAVLAADEAIRAMEEEVAQTGDSAAIADFRAAVKESRERNAAYITSLRVKQGMSEEDALNQVIQDAMQGGVNIKSVTSSVEQLMKDKQEKDKQEKQDQDKK